MVDTATWASQSTEPMPQALTERPMDIDWIKQSFLLSDGDITTTDMVRRVMTSAAFKFTDTTIGGNFAINTPPQFTRYADIKTGGGAVGTGQRRTFSFGESDPVAIYHGISDAWRGLREKSAQGMGMGRYYSEAIDDNAQLVHMRFGLPEYNSLWGFFGGMYDPDASQLARTGRSSLDFLSAPIQSTAAAAGSITGMLLAAPFYPFVLGGRVLRTLTGWPVTKYYYLKPTMALYWDAVTAICNGLAVNMGLSPYSPSDSRKTNYTDQDVFSEKYRNAFAQMLPDIFQPDGLINIRNAATRAQRLANMYNEKLRAAQGFRAKDLITPGKLRDNIRDYVSTLWDGTSDVPKERSMLDYLKDYFEIANNKKKDGDGGNTSAEAGDRTQYGMPGSDDTPPGALQAGAEKVGKWFNYLEGERRDGADFVTFKVDNPGSSSESFSSSTRDSDLSSSLNSTSSQLRSKRFSMAEGNVDSLGLTQAVTGALQSFAENALAKIQLGGVMGLSGLAFVDIPKVWDSSTAQLPRAEFTMQLRAWSGDRLSRFLYELVPTAMILAGALPLSTGSRSYTQPFLCECYSQGRCAIRLGIIESVTIQRGTANVGWTEDHQSMGIDITFSVADLSSVMHMPITTGFKLWEKAWMAAADAVGSGVDQLAGTTNEGGDGTVQNAANNVAAATTPSTYNDDNAYTDYLAVIGSLSLQQMVYGTRKIALQHALRRQQYKTWNSPSRWASVFMDTLPGRALRGISMGTDRDNTR